MEVTWQTVKAILREVLSEEMGMGKCEIAPKFENGTLIIKPENTNLKSKEIPLDAFFKKITSVREKLRVLEQKINNNPTLSNTEKAELQLYITRCYGSLTTFNVLFHHKDDYFEGQKSD